MLKARKPKVAVGMSGGVDSSVAAALLQEEGYEVIGVTLKLWEAAGITDEENCSADSDKESCSLYSDKENCSADFAGSAAKNSPSCSAAEDAGRVAGILGIPHHVFDLCAYFQETVIDYFTRTYLNGETPNPCVVCNKKIKFGEMLRIARELGADYIATGHYAGIIRDEENKRFLLKKSLETGKDQSYVLYTLTQEQLAHTLFPLAKFSKEQIRRIARERNLGVDEKADSQEICFIPDQDYASFVRNCPGTVVEPGNFVDIRGKILGRHRGIIHYTVGQRKGLGMAFGKPMFVVSLNPRRNEVVLGENDDLFSGTLWAENLNWISIPCLSEPISVEAKIRYAAKGAKATVFPAETGTDGGANVCESGEKVSAGREKVSAAREKASDRIAKVSKARVKVCFEERQRAITPGQAVVFYQGDTVVGGGTIISDPGNSDP